ncbi:hypothetical protein NQ314_013152 [Rhamnusium bicolor]|uniref:Gelsolin-like domain-containing protein n=1 Tax=Rhamnusium bicolor TaxID=1586634 RepID=A0AAV8X8R5_9CUCU|nr:hypothetical protein NQ314_013152 [Rhamnusium bicolor]
MWQNSPVLSRILSQWRTPKNQYGKFYTGDSYIVLVTKVKRNGQKTYDLHFWLGSETSTDEAGAAAILSVQLDEQLGGEPIQHREVQEHESQLFLSHFKNGGVRYLPGGISSGFTHVDPNAFENRLFQVKGSRNIRVKQVTPSIASMNDGDCFILDAGRNIYVYVGSNARRVEKLKAINAANQIRDQDHAGKAKVTIVALIANMKNFFEALGEGSKDEVPEESAGGDDQEFESSEESHVSLYRVSDAEGSVHIEKVAQKPLAASLLDPKDCFILDTTDANLYVWIADEFLKSNHYPKWTHVQRIVQGAEPTAFTQYFGSWQAYGELHPRLLRSVSKEARLYHCQLRSKGRKFKMESVEDYEQEDLSDDDIMILDADSEVYLWIGKGASEQEREKGPRFAERMLKRHGREDVPVIVVNQGEEPEEFTSLFPSWDAEFWDNLPDIRDLIKNEDIDED